MKTSFVPLLVLSLLGTVTFSRAGFDPERYKSVEVRELQLEVAEYKNKRVVFHGRFTGIQTTFPKHVERSGFKQDKHVRIETELSNVAVMAKKDDELTELLKELKRGDPLVIYGKIREFRIPSGRGSKLSKYYLDLEHVERDAAANPLDPAGKTGKPLPPGRRRPPLRRKRR